MENRTDTNAFLCAQTDSDRAIVEYYTAGGHTHHRGITILPLIIFFFILMSMNRNRKRKR